jgi:hypothetical protein
MKLLTNILCCTFLSFLLASCEKEEKPIELPPKPAEVKLLSVDMGKDYSTQIFVDISNGKTTSIDNRSWDLAFDASASGVSIYQNSGKNILIGSTGSRALQPYPNLNTIWRWDPASGDQDSLVLNGCLDHQGQITDSVYLVRIGSAPPFCQFKIKTISSDAYLLLVSDLANTWVKETVVPKDPTKNQVYFTFDNGGAYLNPEPPKDSWHICFLRYRWIYYEFNPPLLYLVSGAFVNQHLVTAVKDSVLDFYSITKADCAPKTFLSRRDAIGYDWKSPDLSNTSKVKYTIRKDYYYFIREKTAGERLFKLRFLDFYDNQGVKGTPKFESQQLN